MLVASGSDDEFEDALKTSVEIIDELKSIAGVPIVETIDELPDARYRALMKKYREKIDVEVKK